MSGRMTEAPSFPRFSEPTVIIEPRKSLLHLDLKAIWEYRELLFFLVWRDLKVRYRQTIIGIGWVVLQPVLTMVLFTAVFGNFAKIPSDGVPYPIFTYSALLPWNLFASSLTRGTESVVGNAQLISKIYFPRLLLPISGILSPTIDFAISFVIFAAMMIWFRTLPTWGVLALPLFLILALLTALAVGLWLSALNVRYRDVGHTIPFLVQLWMFASPVAYPVSLAPRRHDTLRDQIMDSLRSIFRSNGHGSASGRKCSGASNTIWALKNVSFEVKHGEVVGLIGRNGAGKSTLLKILSRITDPTTGRAEIYGRVGSLLEVGTGFHGELTGRENIYLNGAILGMRRGEIENKFDQIVAFAEVEKFIGT